MSDCKSGMCKIKQQLAQLFKVSECLVDKTSKVSELDLTEGGKLVTLECTVESSNCKVQITKCKLQSATCKVQSAKCMLHGGGVSELD